jgi:hypothetical protein
LSLTGGANEAVLGMRLSHGKIGFFAINDCLDGEIREEIASYFFTTLGKIWCWAEGIKAAV